VSHDEESREPAPLRADALRMLATWREADTMPGPAKARVWTRLRTRPPAPVHRATVWVWAVAIAAAVLLVWWGVVQIHGSLRDAEAVPRDQAIDQPPVSEPATVDMRAQPSAPPRSVAPAVSEPATPPAETLAPRPVDDRTSRPSTRRVEPQSGPTTEPAIVRERDMIARAWSALADGDPGAALHRAAEHEQAFPDGLLAPERRAIVLIARCKRGDRDADARARAWLESESRSPLASRVRSACISP